MNGEQQQYGRGREHADGKGGQGNAFGLHIEAIYKHGVARYVQHIGQYHYPERQNGVAYRAENRRACAVNAHKRERSREDSEIHVGMAAHVGRKVAEKPSGDERLQGIGRQSQQRARQSHEQHHLNRRVGRTQAVGIAEILPYHHRSAYGKGRKQTVEKGNNEVHQRHARNGSLANAGHHNGVDNAHGVMQQQFARYRQEQQQYVAIREVSIITLTGLPPDRTKKHGLLRQKTQTVL